jgi:ATP phosphoribosyltransferase regulatory subunit
MVAIVVEVLQGLGFTDFKVDLGQVEFFRGILAASGLAGEAQRELREAIGRKDAAAVRQVLEREQLPDSVKEELAALPRLFGGRDVLNQAARVVHNDRSRRALDNLGQVLDILEMHGIGEHLTVDLGELRGLDYHTGVTFEGFVGGLGEAVCGGGRYDGLTARYGFPAPATGFAFNLLALLAALEKRPEVDTGTSRDFLLFNLQEDRREALEIARHLRRCGYSTARDIIRRDFANSLAYARRLSIRRMLVLGGDQSAADEVYLVRVCDSRGVRVKKAELMRDDFTPQFDEGN